VPLGSNVLACADLCEACADADILVLCAPHQFIRSICQQLVGKVGGRRRRRACCRGRRGPGAGRRCCWCPLLRLPCLRRRAVLQVLHLPYPRRPHPSQQP
jgi:hypothetical protein